MSATTSATGCGGLGNFCRPLPAIARQACCRTTGTTSAESFTCDRLADDRGLLVLGDRPRDSLFVADPLQLLQRLVDPRPQPPAGREGGRKVLHALDHPDGLIVHGGLGIAAVVRHPVEHRREHRLEHHPRDIGADAAVDAETEAEVAVVFLAVAYLI